MNEIEGVFILPGDAIIVISHVSTVLDDTLNVFPWIPRTLHREMVLS